MSFGRPSSPLVPMRYVLAALSCAAPLASHSCAPAANNRPSAAHSFRSLQHPWRIVISTAQKSNRALVVLAVNHGVVSYHSCHIRVGRSPDSFRLVPSLAVFGFTPASAWQAHRSRRSLQWLVTVPVCATVGRISSSAVYWIRPAGQMRWRCSMSRTGTMMAPWLGRTNRRSRPCFATARSSSLGRSPGPSGPLFSSFS